MAGQKRFRKRKKVRNNLSNTYPIRWLPIDSRFITPFFKFGSVTGMARLFLEIEITLAIMIVVGTLAAAGIRIVQFAL